MSIVQDLQKKYYELLNPINKGLSSLGNAAKPIIKPVASVVSQASPSLGALSNINNYAQIFSKLPQVDISSKVKTPVYKFGAEIGENLINSPRTTAQGLQGLRTQATDMYTKAQLPKPQALLSNIGKSADLPLNLLGGIGVGSLEKNIAEQGFKPLAKQGLLATMKDAGIQGGKIGAQFGLAGGLRSGENITDPFEYAKNLGLSTLQGTAGGALLGAGGAGAGYGLNKVNTSVQHVVKQQAIENFAAKLKNMNPQTFKGFDEKVIKPYRNAFSISNKTESEIRNAVVNFQNGNIGDETAYKTLTDSTSKFLPQFKNLDTVSQSKIWNYLLSRKRGFYSGDEVVPPGLQQLDKEIFRVMGIDVRNAGKISFGASVGGEDSAQGGKLKAGKQKDLLQSQLPEDSATLSNIIPQQAKAGGGKNGAQERITDIGKRGNQYEGLKAKQVVSPDVFGEPLSGKGAIRSTQSIDEATVQKYMKQIENNISNRKPELNPPVIIDNYRGFNEIVDGHNRAEAYRRLGLYDAPIIKRSDISSLPQQTGGAKQIEVRKPNTIQSLNTIEQPSNSSLLKVGGTQQRGQVPGSGQIPPEGPLKLTGGSSAGSIPQKADSFLNKVKSKVDDIYTASLDRFHPISKLGKQAGEDQAMRNALTGYYGAGSIGKYHTEFELSPILKSVDVDELRRATIALRDAELKQRGIKGSNTSYLDEMINGKKIGESNPKLGEAIKKLYAYQDNLVKEYLVKTGIMSKEGYNAMKANNQFYVPFKRVMDQVDEHLGVPQTKGAGSVSGQNVIKGIKGSNRDIIDPIQSIIENTYKIVGLGKRQEVARTIIGLKSQLPEGTIKPFTGTEVGRKPVISLFENGKVKKYLVPEEVADAAKGLSEEGLNTIVKILNAPTRVFRETATGINPEFAIPNVARDLQSTFINNGLNPLKFVSGLAHYMKKDEVYQDFLKAGGQTSRLSLDQKFLSQTTKELAGQSKGLRIVDPRRIYSILKEIGQASEQPTRIASFESARNNALKQGLSDASARGAYAAQEGSVNFARRGSQTQSINAIYAFVNARAQGVDRLVRSFKDDPKGVGLRLGMITVAPAIGLYAYNRGFQSYNDERIVPAYVKQNNFVIMLSDTPIEHLGGAQYITIPKGDVGKLANPLEAFMSYADGKGGDVGAALGSVLQGFSPINNVGDIIPTALRPAVENAANFNFFTNRAIVPESKKNYPAPFQANKNTPAIYKQAGALTNQSPNMIENLTRGYLTGFARLGEMATQPFAKQDTYSGEDINQTPVVRRFLGGAQRTEEDQQLIDSYKVKDLQNKIQDIKTGIKYGNIPEADGINAIEKLINQVETETKKAQSYIGPKMSEAAGNDTASTIKSDIQDSLLKTKVENSGKSVFDSKGDLIYKNENGNAATITLSPPTKGSGIDAFENKNWAVNKALEVFKSNIPQDQKKQAYEKLGVAGDIEYAYKANKNNDIKTQYLISKNLSHDALINKIIDTRKRSIAGDVYSSDGVINNLKDQGLITAQEAKYLKIIDYNKDGTKKVTVSKGRKGRKIVFPKMKLITLKIPKAKRVKSVKSKIKRVKQYNLTKVKLKGKLTA